MPPIADTPEPPYYAVIFTSFRTDEDTGYSAMAEKMLSLAQGQPGFLGVKSVRDEVGITISYWSDLESIDRWRQNAHHREAQRLGREKWYATFMTRVLKVERDGAKKELSQDS